EELVEGGAVRGVEEVGEEDKGLRRREITMRKRTQRDAGHLLAARPHLLEPLEEARRRLDVGNELGELRDRHAVVGHALEMEVDVKDRQHEAQVARDRRLPRE